MSEQSEYEALTCDCMSKLGFKTCNVCIDYQRKYVRAIKQREKNWREAIDEGIALQKKKEDKQ